MYAFQLFFEVSAKRGDSYDLIMKLPDVDFCKIVGEIEANLFLSEMLKHAKNIGGEVLESCTRMGEIKNFNISCMNSSFTRILPAGHYRSTVRLYDDTDDNIVNVSSDTSIFH